MLATGGEDGTVKLWKIEQKKGEIVTPQNSQPISLPEKELARVYSVAFSSNGLLNFGGKYTFRTVPSDKAAQALAEHMRNKYPQSKAVVFYNSQSEYSNSQAKEFINDIGSLKVLNKIDLSVANFDAAKSIEKVQQETVLVLMPNVEKLDKALMVVEANAQRH